MARFILITLILLNSLPAYASFKTECLDGFEDTIAKRLQVPANSVGVTSTRMIQNLSRDKLCGIRYLHEIRYSVQKENYSTGGYALILYTCGGCELIGNWMM